MPARYKETVRAIVKQKLGTGIVSDFSDFRRDLLMDAEDIIYIIEYVENEYQVEFTDSEHFDSKSIDDICKILSTKNITNSMITSFGGIIED